MNKKGFTLVEIMIAVSIFAVVMVISMDIFLKSFASQRRIIEMQKVQREGFYVMEIMSRKIRMAALIESQSADPDESINQDSSFYFTNNEGAEIEFCRSDEDGICNDDDTGDYLAYGLESQLNKDLAISSDVRVENLKFYVLPEDAGKKQYVVTIDLDLVSTKNSDVRIDLQSSISTRIYNDGVIEGGAGGPVPSGYCGDGIVQAPNGDSIIEFCDEGDASHGAGNTNVPCDPACDNSCTYCDNSCVSHTVTKDPDWITGVCSGIGVYNQDSPINLTFALTRYGEPCGAPQCDALGVITGDPAIDLSDYPAAEYCQSIGGRLPSLSELECIYANMDNLGGVASFVTSNDQDITDDGPYYWSNQHDRCATGIPTSYNGAFVDKISFESANYTYGYKDHIYHTRCVKDLSCGDEIAPDALCGNGDLGGGEECDYGVVGYENPPYYPVPYPIDDRCYWVDTFDSGRVYSGDYCDRYCIRHNINAYTDLWDDSLFVCPNE